MTGKGHAGAAGSGAGAGTVPDPIPVIWCEPKEKRKTRDLAIWLTHFTGTKEKVQPQLHDLAEAGFVAVSFDLREHGERVNQGETQEAMAARVMSNRRRYFWPILGRTAEDFPAVIDWAADHFQINGRIVAGGISMGGDICLAAAAVDRRIEAVCACIATPDWLREGSAEEQGEADRHSLDLYGRWNPMTHPGLYAHRPWLRFENGNEDRLVPAPAARAFQSLLQAGPYRDEPHKIEVMEYPGVGHSFTADMWKSSLDWFSRIRTRER